MKSSRKNEKLFSLDQFLIRSACFVFLLGLVVVCFSAPLLDKFDKWTEDINNQVKMFYFIAGCFAVMFVPRLFKN